MNASGAAGLAAKPSYDPAKALEGMFKGAVIRVAQSLRDPKNYGASTSIVLPEVTKRFHDAIDDIEIQLLEAKWDLEARLAANRTARELEQAASTVETGSAKRKRTEDDVKDGDQENVSSKRAKVEEVKPEVSEKEALASSNTAEAGGQLQTNSLESDRVQQPTVSVADAKSRPMNTEAKQNIPQSSASQLEPTASQDTRTELPPSKPPDKPRATAEASQTEQGEVATKDNEQDIQDDNEFESMFDIPAGDTKHNVDSSITFGNAFDHNIHSNDLDVNSGQNDSSLNSLLPGLGDYANQAPDDAGSAQHVGQNPAAPVDPRPDSVGSLGNEFDLPDFGGPNEFDDLLNDAFDFGGGTNDGDNTVADTFDDLFGDGQ